MQKKNSYFIIPKIKFKIHKPIFKIKLIIQNPEFDIRSAKFARTQVRANFEFRDS